MKLTNKSTFIVILSLLTIFLQPVYTYQLYCKCECNAKTIINPIDKCKLCTEEYCLSQDEKLCDSEDTTDDKSGSIIISCFQVESFKESLVIYLFLTIVIGLMGYIGYSSFRNRNI